MADEQEILNRWRLVLGKYASGQISFSGGGLNYMDMENVLDYLYSREYGEEQEIRKDRQGGSDGSQLTVPSWLHQVKKLFPKLGDSIWLFVLFAKRFSLEPPRYPTIGPETVITGA